jgi:hypothetical protein
LPDPEGVNARNFGEENRPAGADELVDEGDVGNETYPYSMYEDDGVIRATMIETSDERKGLG